MGLERKRPDTFISYRRVDTAAAAQLLATLLRYRFGDQHIFLDSQAIIAGEAWPQRLQEAVRACDIFLAVIGPDYVSMKRSGADVCRIFERDDWVRRELETAIHYRKVIIPVLVDGAHMPNRMELPSELYPLLDRQAFSFRVDHARNDADRLADFFAPEVELTWEKFEHAIVTLAYKIGPTVDVFVGVGVGGAILGSTLAGNMNKTFLASDRTVRYVGARKRIVSLVDHGSTIHRVSLVEGKRVMVASAEIVSGGTTAMACRWMEQLGALSIATCCIYAYEGRTYRADHFYRERRTGGIVQMPWRILQSYTNPDDLVRPPATERNDY
jgi:hypoxanthine phosphoribosyltransferase